MYIAIGYHSNDMMYAILRSLTLCFVSQLYDMAVTFLKSRLLHFQFQSCYKVVTIRFYHIMQNVDEYDKLLIVHENFNHQKYGANYTKLRPIIKIFMNEKKNSSKFSCMKYLH